MRIMGIVLFLISTGCTTPPDSGAPVVVDKVPASQGAMAEKEVVALPSLVLPTHNVDNNPKVQKFCKMVDEKFLYWGWGKSDCEKLQWNHVRNSVKGLPLVWTVFGDEDAHKVSPQNTTFVMCGVHGDEITPIKFCFDIIDHLLKVASGEKGDPKDLENRLIVVAPIVSPDSFFKKVPTRTNSRGVDVNRNFPTEDWKKDALRLWKAKYKKDTRRFPGDKAFSEPETVFQVNLIARYNPHRIISVHAPLTILDYDGPLDHPDPVVNKFKANSLLVQMSKEASGYQIKNYPVFPGSLGNYAGVERNIPTYTLELPSSDNRQHKDFWNRLSKAIHTALFHDLRTGPEDVSVVDSINKTKDREI